MRTGSFKLAYWTAAGRQDGNSFPGTGSGTITGITTSSPLTGSGTSGSVALGLNQSALETTFNSIYPQLATSNRRRTGWKTSVQGS
jgi:hypothetical protein